jgi:transcription-repair coupling factor (superfamily II helicase)
VQEYLRELKAYVGQVEVLSFNPKMADLSNASAKLGLARFTGALRHLGLALCSIETLLYRFNFAKGHNGLMDSLTLRRGQDYAWDDLPERLVALGYERASRTDLPGSFALHGDTIDIFVADQSAPARLEFFGDRIERIYRIVASTGQSIADLEQLEIGRCQLPDLRQVYLSECHALLDYIADEALIVLVEPKLLFDSMLGFYKKHQQEITEQSPLLAAGAPAPSDGQTTSDSPAAQALSPLAPLLEPARVDFSSHPTLSLLTLHTHAEQIDQRFVPDPELARQIDETKRQAKLAAQLGAEQDDQDQDPTRTRFPFKPGDYVVHEQFGIAYFKEVSTQTIAGVTRDYLQLCYADDGKLLLPIDQIDKVTKYVGAGQKAPKLSSLSKGDFSKLYKKAKRSAHKMAFDLADVYLRRLEIPGFAYQVDTPELAAFERAFKYVETPDQLKAIQEVKRDMARPRPMDRLICGDVGFGKTEVAMRAAYIAVQSGKQVMFLCPTTILAEQHFEKFQERFEPFGVRVGALSRIVDQKRQKELLEHYHQGKLDILIGTHRLLSADVNPKALGLVVIDEEQRFGVVQKESFKNLRAQIDVLTLSATPIPRTLQMSLSSVRDLSIIETPPQGRRPVEVYVGEWSQEIVRRALEVELGRSGQVYYVSNRVDTIDMVADALAKLAPQARFGVVHGQLSPKQLQEIMQEFYAAQIDVLISTTIIESGLDNPNCNTIIIENAHRLGLSQMYQLKGRVGRSDLHAYSYFLFPPRQPLSEVQAARLVAIDENQELGSGLKIAMKDLEIRGAGSMLGAEQSGNVSAVGFDLFMQLLAPASAEAAGRQRLNAPDVQIDLPADQLLPSDYIEGLPERIAAYRRIAALSSLRQVSSYKSLLKSEYGELPPPAENMFERAACRVLAAGLGVKRVSLLARHLVLEPLYLNADDLERLHKYRARYDQALQQLKVPVKTTEHIFIDLKALLRDLSRS